MYGGGRKGIYVAFCREYGATWKLLPQISNPLRFQTSKPLLGELSLEVLI